MKRETIDLFNRIFKVLEPPPDLTLSQWADRYRRLSSESGSKGGKWNTEKAPWQREIMDAITDISVEKVVVMSAAQMGKTDAFLLNTIGYYMHYDPCTILCMQPTLSLAETMSKDRLTLNFRTVTNNAIKLHEPRQHNIDLRAAQQQKDTVKGTTEVVSVKHILVVTPKKLNPGKVATAAAAEVSGEYAVSYYATYIDGKKKLEIDPLNYIYYVNGKDYLADVRKALGK